jgi:hypothetical protein
MMSVLFLEAAVIVLSPPPPLPFLFAGKFASNGLPLMGKKGKSAAMSQIVHWAWLLVYGGEDS